MTVDASQCPGACSVDGWCQFDVPVAEAEEVCQASRTMTFVSTIIGMVVVNIIFLCFFYHCCLQPWCDKRSKRKSMAEYAMVSYLNEPGTPIGVWPQTYQAPEHVDDC